MKFIGLNKHRGWSRAENRWVYGSLIQKSLRYGSCPFIYEWALGEECEELEIEVTWKSVGRFTGFFSIGWKEIWEDDIFNTKPARYEVVYEDGAFYAKFLMGLKYKERILLSEIYDQAILLGNIHENPDLLKDCLTLGAK